MGRLLVRPQRESHTTDAVVLYGYCETCGHRVGVVSKAGLHRKEHAALLAAVDVLDPPTLDMFAPVQDVDQDGA